VREKERARERGGRGGEGREGEEREREEERERKWMEREREKGKDGVRAYGVALLIVAAGERRGLLVVGFENMMLRSWVMR